MGNTMRVGRSVVTKYAASTAALGYAPADNQSKVSQVICLFLSAHRCRRTLRQATMNYGA